MKKFLRFLIITILVVAAAILVIALLEPNDFTVSRTVVINAPKEAVFEQMVKYKNWTHWSPWYKLDSTMKLTYNGEEGAVGSSYHWVGDEKKTGEGEMKTVTINGTSMDCELHFLKPFESKAKSFLIAKDSAGMTKATWGFSQHMSFPWNAALLVMNMEKLLGPDFENGLKYMKEYVEKNVVPAAKIDVKEVDYAEHIFAGIRKEVNMSDIGSYCAVNCASLGKDLGDKVTGPQSNLYYTWDTATHSTDMVVAFPVTDTTKMPKGLSLIHVGPARAFMAYYKGAPSKSMEAHVAIGKAMAAKGLMQQVVIEENVVTAPQEPDSTKWETNIYYIVK